MKQFGIVMTFRDTPRERKVAGKSLPSFIVLKLDELVIGVDSPADQSFINYTLKTCQPFKDVNIVQVPPWTLHSARWVSKNPEHMMVRTAHNKSQSEYEYLGSTYIQDVDDWAKIGRSGTRFG